MSDASTNAPVSAVRTESAGTDLLIHKVLSRGAGAAAQVLLVLVSAESPLRADDGVWVGIGIDTSRVADNARDTPFDLRQPGAARSVELAQPMTWGQLEALDRDADADDPGPHRPFGLDAALLHRCFGLARFDFSDHVRLGERWLNALQPDPAATRKAVQVVAWRRRAEDAGAPAAREYPRPAADEPLFEAAVDEVVAQALFELGVLFVHGIGNHLPRQTLVLWSEPIVKFWRDLTRRIGERAQAQMAPGDRIRLRDAVERGPLLNRGPQDGISQAVGDFAKRAPGDAERDGRHEGRHDGRLDAESDPPAAPPAGPPQTCIAAVKAEQTVFEDLAREHDSAALLRVSSVDGQAVLRESHVLFTEAYWTRESFAPSFSELFLWLTTATPIAAWAEMRRIGTVRSDEIRERFKAAEGAVGRLRPSVDLVLWIAQMAVMPALYLLGALASQVLIGVVGLIGLIVPIPWVRATSRAVVNALMGTVGQSFALQLSPVRRSAVVTRVQGRLDWLSEQCHQVVVISHSQGAEVTRRVFGEKHRRDIARWYSFGAGIAPLTMLHPKNVETVALQRLAACSKLLLVAAMLGLLALALDAIPGVDSGLRAWLWLQLRGLALWPTLAWLVIVSVLALLLGNWHSPAAPLMTRRSVMKRWCNLYASNDPVPGGSLFGRFSAEIRDRKLPMPEERQLFNTRFAVLDHTSYWKNIEQFVAPIALDLMALMGHGIDAGRQRPALDHAARRRDLLTWWMQLAVIAALLASTGLACFQAFGPPARGAAWWAQGSALWQAGEGWFHNLGSLWHGGLVGGVVRDLWLPLAVLASLLAPVSLRLWLGSRSARQLVDELAGG